MCPFCLATAVWITAAAISTTGAAALVIGKAVTTKASPHNSPKSPSKEDHNG